MTEAEILEKQPLSGEFEEHCFCTSGNTLWVKFLDDQYIEWVGIFGCSEWPTFSTIIKLPNKNQFFIVAGGQGYFVDPNTREVIDQTEWDNISGALYNNNTDEIILTDGLRLALLKENKIHWVSERISADGIEFINQSNNIISGTLNDLTADWCEFKFDVFRREIKAQWEFYKNWG
ncbi:hypothetical protein P4C99_21320 [Pontiellaceae bacterium B1224]|nr:hypothetical protein [Pontiellaceae bacterium B1224]